MKIIGIIMFIILTCYMVLGGKYFLDLESKYELNRKEKIIGYGAVITIATFPIWCFVLFKMMGL